MKLKHSIVIGSSILGIVLLTSFQNCGTKLNSQSELNSLTISELSTSKQDTVIQTCSPIQSQNCETAKGFGVQFCTDSGQPKECKLESCKAGYLLSNGICTEQACLSNSQVSCNEKNGTGFKICKPDLTSYGDCQLSSCNLGYHLVNGSCVVDLCKINEVTACSENNGNGTHKCNTNGTGYDSCQITSCKVGFNLQNGKCIENACLAGTSMSCHDGNGSGSKVCNSTGTGFGACQINKCDTGYFITRGVCYANYCEPSKEIPCTQGSGIGTGFCSDTGSGLLSCNIKSCKTGYHLVNVGFENRCLVDECSDGNLVSCKQSNGTGTFECKSGALGECRITKCDDTFTMVNGICVCPVNTAYDNGKCVDSTPDLPSTLEKISFDPGGFKISENAGIYTLGKFTLISYGGRLLIKGIETGTNDILPTGTYAYRLRTFSDSPDQCTSYYSFDSDGDLAGYVMIPFQGVVSGYNIRKQFHSNTSGAGFGLSFTADGRLVITNKFNKIIWTANKDSFPLLDGVTGCGAQ